MNKCVLAVLVGGLLVISAPARAEDPARASRGGPADPSCCIVMVSGEEPGEPLIVTGTVYAEDGKTPVAGARLYVYQTDALGRYAKSLLSRTPRLRGWMETGADGRYEFRTIKPGAYPGERIPAHIHGTLSAPGYPARWIDDFWFDGDPHLKGRGPRAREAQGRFLRGSGDGTRRRWKPPGPPRLRAHAGADRNPLNIVTFLSPFTGFGKTSPRGHGGSRYLRMKRLSIRSLSHIEMLP